MIGESIMMALGDIVVGDHRVRSRDDDERIASLAESIRAEGLLAPLIVRIEAGVAKLVVGDRRWRACLSLGWTEVPVRILAGSEADAKRAVFAENFHRRDITAVEQAAGIKDAIDSGDIDEAGVARAFGNRIEWVRRQVAILDWPSDILEALHLGQIALSPASWLARISDSEYREFLLRQACGSGVTTRTAEQWYHGWEATRPMEQVALEQAPAETQPEGSRVPQSPCMICSDSYRPDGMSAILVCVGCIAELRDRRRAGLRPR